MGKARSLGHRRPEGRRAGGPEPVRGRRRGGPVPPRRRVLAGAGSPGPLP
ncbi:hypothetical protein SCATT_52790 [Streptantibioticus cattleyicolor NRRL 8057 = DSM 46488]|uniref:Uncharacterized protein n=1 Tax=Streptantibioticus cattleyicolor (strain ATCC 35852 / DSM 46488 / JCM 4925 / NBRC 14057 / NRRL 8057) TaxID=1003195 RepID=G8X122_STREN|nr:hypothetical protein SCATT_52790 [Streptantibioticus cattleyicolor NRRL 8057 = DSM 46488]